MSEFLGKKNRRGEKLWKYGEMWGELRMKTGVPEESNASYFNANYLKKLTYFVWHTEKRAIQKESNITKEINIKKKGEWRDIERKTRIKVLAYFQF